MNSENDLDMHRIMQDITFEYLVFHALTLERSQM